jgi:hypothetical protein
LTTASPASQTARHAGQTASVLADAPHQAAAAVSRADLPAALAQAERAEHAVTGLRLAIVADMLADGTDWWQAGAALAMHPQAPTRPTVTLPAAARPRQPSGPAWPSCSLRDWTGLTTCCRSTASTSMTSAPITA